MHSLMLDTLDLFGLVKTFYIGKKAFDLRWSRYFSTRPFHLLFLLINFFDRPSSIDR